MRFTELSDSDKEYIIERYKATDLNTDGTLSKDMVQEELSEMFDVAKRTIRTWIKTLGLVSKKHEMDSRILIYDIETSRCEGKFWWTGKQFVGYKQITKEPAIISISWKWLGEDTIQHVVWDEAQDDKKLLEEFLKEYNSADMIVGQNSDKFDNRWVNARAAKHNLFVDVFPKSFDLMKQTKRLFRLPSYSMDYLAKFYGVSNKLEHEGIVMWDKIEDGTKEEQKEYLQKMVDYNVGDIITTEALFTRLRKYMGNMVHFGSFKGEPRYTCPHCGGSNVRRIKSMTTAAGTVQHTFMCKDDKVQYRVSNTEFKRYLNR